MPTTTTRRARHGEARAELLRIMALPPTDDCLDGWPFSTTEHGYPYGWDGTRTVVLSNVVCADEHGPRPTPKHEVAHSCGNHRCLNRRHVRWATHVENEADKHAHGTTYPGSKHAAIADDVRADYETGDFTMAALAAKYSVGIATVHRIVHRVSTFEQRGTV